MRLLRNNALGVVVFLIGVAMMVAGSARGEVSVVLAKAITVCLECIGIG